MGSGPSLLDRRILVLHHGRIFLGGNSMADTVNATPRDAIGRYQTLIDELRAESRQLRFNLIEAYGRIERLKEQVLELELAVATAPE